jgi:hypothetical protein
MVSSFRSREDLVLENLALHQQLTAGYCPVAATFLPGCEISRLAVIDEAGLDRDAALFEAASRRSPR